MMGPPNWEVDDKAAALPGRGSGSAVIAEAASRNSELDKKCFSKALHSLRSLLASHWAFVAVARA